MLRKTIVIFFIILVACIVFYTSQDGYSLAKKVDRQILNERFSIIDSADHLIFELDLRRIMRSIILSNEDYIDLKLSRGDMEHLQASKETSLQRGFISDRENQWRLRQPYKQSIHNQQT